VPAPTETDLVGLHRQNNRETAGSWAGFGAHREKVTALALEGAAEGGVATLAVLGAGNCNDLDLEALAARVAQVHLVDLDEEALRRARDRHRPEVARQLVLHAPVDLSGVAGQLAGFRRKPATPQQLATLPTRGTEAVLAALPGPFDRVISTCFLSQLLQSAFVCLGPRHPQLHILACALALAHMRAMVQLVRPGGSAVVITDAVSTETYPLVELWDRQPPLTLLAELERADNVFSGTGPAFLRRLLVSAPLLGPLVAGAPRLHQPWLWTFSEERSYLVYALSFARAAAVPG
jgi:hypothetical protein